MGNFNNMEYYYTLLPLELQPASMMMRYFTNFVAKAN